MSLYESNDKDIFWCIQFLLTACVNPRQLIFDIFHYLIKKAIYLPYLLTLSYTGQNISKQNILEVEVLKKTNHENIIKYHESFFSGGKLHIVLEYADRGTLESVIQTNGCNKDEYNIW